MKPFIVWTVLIAALSTFVPPAGATLPAAVAWEVRSVSSNTNGGGFVTGATGTDMSQFNNKNAAACTSCQSSTANLSTVDAVANGTSTITSATAVFSSAIVGNVIFFSGGTGSIAAQWRQVTTFTNATTIAIDANIAVSTGMTMNIGGALATPAQALANMVTSNIIFSKNTATYQTNASLILPNSTNVTPTNATPPNQFICYNTTRTDGGQCTIQLITNTGLKGFDGSNAGGWYISNVILDCNSLGTSEGFHMNANSVVRNWVAKNCTSVGMNLVFTNSLAINGEATGNSGTAAVYAQGNGTSVEQCYVHGNTTVGILTNGQPSSVLFNISANNSGVSSDGIQCGNFPCRIENNTTYNNGRDGIRMANNSAYGPSTVKNNLNVQNTEYGLLGFTSAGWASYGQEDGNAYYLNGTANRFNYNDTGATNPINGANPYTNTLDLICSTQPMVNPGSNNFALSSSGCPGVRGGATPGAMPVLGAVGFMSFGALQPQASGSGANSAYAQ